MKDVYDIMEMLYLIDFMESYLYLGFQIQCLVFDTKLRS